MPRKATFSVRPAGWAKSREDWMRLSPLDLVITQQYNNYALIFRMENDSDQPSIADTVRQALETTLSQCRHVAGTIEKNEYGDFSIVTKPDSTVPFVVQWVDAREDQCPTYPELESAHFCSERLGNPASLANQGMTKISEASANISPAVAGFQLNFIPGGMILTANIHHFAMDVIGTSSFVHQLAAHCHSLRHGTLSPFWDESLIDRRRLIPPLVPVEAMEDPQPSPPRHPDWLPCAWLLFHIPLSKIAELKSLAMPTDGSWISSYDAISAFLWRVLSKNRAHIYKPDLSSLAMFGESVDMRNRLRPPFSKRYQGNLQCAGLSFLQEKQFTLAEIISEAPLSCVAAFVRKITNDMTHSTLEATIAKVAPVRDKSNLHFRLDSIPPMSIVVTDWRDADMCMADFGFGRPVAIRQLADKAVENLMIIYPRRTVKSDSDHGLEIVVPFEKHAVDMLIKDPDLNQFFTFRGFEAGAPS